MTQQLVRFDAARHALAEARSVDEVKDVRDRAEALRLYMKQAGHGLEMQNDVAEIKLRAERVKARRMMEKAGLAHKGDGKDVDHIRPLKSGGTSARSNLRMRDKTANRSDKR